MLAASTIRTSGSHTVPVMVKWVIAPSASGDRDLALELQS
jgi:hypothetical protein